MIGLCLGLCQPGRGLERGGLFGLMLAFGTEMLSDLGWFGFWDGVDLDGGCEGGILTFRFWLFIDIVVIARHFERE